MESYASNEPRIGIMKTAMGACAQFAVFTYAEMQRTPRYEIRLAAFFADNLMNSEAHCGGFYLRDIVEEKCRLRPACRKLPGLSREKTWITPRLSETSGAQQRKNVNYRAFRNVGYNKRRDAHRGRMFRLLWTFVDLKLPSAMSHAIHKIVSKERCQSYFISRRSPHLGISKDSELCERPSLSSLCLCAAHCSHNFLVISGPGADFPALHPAHTACPSRCRGRSWAYWHRGSRSRR